MADEKTKSSTVAKAGAAGSAISIATVIGLWSTVSPILHSLNIKTDQIDKVVTVIDQHSGDIDKIQDQVNTILKVLPKPAPTPIPEPTPHVEPVPVIDPKDQLIKDLRDKIEQLIKPPAPVPVPTPIATDLKIVDSSGKVLTNPIESGKQVKVVASGAGKWLIQTESPADEYDVTEYPDHLICTLRNGAKLAISHATESPLSVTGIMVKCQDAPRPPPVPVPVDPVEPDKKQSTTHKVGAIYICVNPGQTSVDESIVIKDLPYWDNLRATGITVSMHTPSAADEIGKWALEQMKAKGIPPPAMVMVDKDRFLLDVVPVPKNVAGVEAAISKVGGR